MLREARELGAVQLGISGGEPLLRGDVEVMVADAHRLGYYTNLLTSGVGLTEKRIAAFKEGGLDQIQLSFQDSARELNDPPQTHCPAVKPDAHAHWKLKPPSWPVTSTTSPMKYSPATCFASIIFEDSSSVSTPPSVTSAFA